VAHLMKLDLKSGAVTQLTNGHGESSAFCMQGGGSVLYMQLNAAGQYKVYKLSLADGKAVPFSDLTAFAWPFLSPDGRHVVIITVRKDGAVVAAKLSAGGALEGEYAVDPTIDPDSHAATWMPDSTRFAVADLRSGSPNIWSMPLDNGAAKQLTHFESGIIWVIRYSPDGKWVGFTRSEEQKDAILLTNAH